MMALTCEYCGKDDGLSFCTRCGDYVCNDCWDKRRKHREGEDTGGGIPHEKVAPHVVQQLTQCMAQPSTEREQIQQHVDDEDTTWFGFDRDEDGSPFLAEYQRYASLMMDCAQEPGSQRYPALVSFIGQTGAGKSSLIKLLMDMNASLLANGGPTLSAPIVGRNDSDQPTSADVHLYVDPATCTGERPILYADCEGFDGGERDPVAVAALNKAATAKDTRANPFKRLARGTKRFLQWADSNSPGYKEKAKRGYAIAEMYPRIFYAFSDVVVFVLNQPKTVEIVVERLLNWAAANYANTANLPSKPHAIIALNKSDNATAEYLWDTVHATSSLLESASAQIDKNPVFKAYVSGLKEKGIGGIDNMKDLLRRYYSTVQVVRIPELGRYKVLDDQRHVLYEMIRGCCDKSQQAKAECRMSLNADELGLYLSLAFDHFSADLDRPFDFIKASLRRHPPPETFKDNVLSLARMFAKQRGESAEGNIEELFTLLVPLVASCLMLDSVRKNRFGLPETWFKATMGDSAKPHVTRDKKGTAAQQSSYQAMCEGAVEEYFSNYGRCKYEIPYYPYVGSTILVPCDERKRTHGFLHRGSLNRGGMIHRVEIPGDFQSHFRSSSFAWSRKVLTNLETLHGRMYQAPEDKKRSYVSGHAERLHEFYDQNGIAPEDCKSNALCLACLFNPPEHELNCGHLLCTQCALDYGKRINKRTIAIKSCPLHVDQDQSSISSSGTSEDDLDKYHDEVLVRTEPRHAGLRVLTLDGGGVRGIIELGIMKALEDEIGIHLQQFFDVVVGTSTGGIVALAFGDSGRTLAECQELFRSLVHQAFSRRQGQEIPWLKHFQTVLKSKYKTRPLESALKAAFSQQSLFGRRTDPGVDSPKRLKVAVLSVSNGGDTAYVISNYNTRNDSRGVGPQYRRYRPDQPDDELKVWEAARATSAAPGFFRPHPKHLTNKHTQKDQVFPQLVDGALRYNNPIEIALEEASRLSEAGGQAQVPDLVLSIGTGKEKPFERRDNDVSPSDLLEIVPGFQRLKTLFTMLKFQIKLNLDTDTRWEAVQNSRPDLLGRLARINPDLGIPPPALDDTGAVQEIWDRVTRLTKANTDVNDANPGVNKQLKLLARRLVASSFYFEKHGSPAVGPDSSWILPGCIRCRLDPSNNNMQNLARYLSRSGDGARFVVRASPRAGDDVYAAVGTEALLKTGEFSPPLVQIAVSGEDTVTTIFLEMRGAEHYPTRVPISGFPRMLMKLDFAAS